MFKNASIDLSCPQCQTKIKKTIGWIKQSTQFTCTRCGSIVKLQKDQFIRELKKADKAVDDFKRKLKSMKIDIKL